MGADAHWQASKAWLLSFRFARVGGILCSWKAAFRSLTGFFAAGRVHPACEPDRVCTALVNGKNEHVP